MKPFHLVAVPHRDVVEGKITMDTFASDLWEVHVGRAPEEYRDPELFFKRTHQTEGLKRLVEDVKRRLSGEGGDPVIQLQTPFGGGKTHALITLYHSSADWGVKRVVISGQVLDPNEKTFWAEIEEQLEGRVTFDKMVPPGRDKIRELLEKNSPVMILIDETMHYLHRADGIKVGNTTLATQTINFMQILTEAVKNVDKAVLVITLPSSHIELYGGSTERMEELMKALQKVVGRVERVVSPIRENEIPLIVRRRLFKEIDEEEMKGIVDEVVEFFARENMIPEGMEVSEYRDLFRESYPFLPEVIRTLYHRWGSFPEFQRTRGVLRILALVVRSLKNSMIPYITLADFDLSDTELRRELTKYTGPEFESIIAQDITDSNSGASRVDAQMPDSVKGLKLGTRCARTIFMYSFSGGSDNGATVQEIKINAAMPDVIPSMINEAIEKLTAELFYLRRSDGKYLFSTKPNLNRMILNKMENISDEDVVEDERNVLREFSGRMFQSYVWPESPSDVPDSRILKLVIMNSDDREKVSGIISTRGGVPRVYKNTLIFLVPTGTRSELRKALRKIRACKEILESGRLVGEEKEDIRRIMQEERQKLHGLVRKYYRTILVPSSDGLEEIDMGAAGTWNIGDLGGEVFGNLKSSDRIADRISPMMIESNFLSGKEWVSTHDIYESYLRVPGEIMITGKEVVEEAIREGVETGLFGLGRLSDGEPECLFIGSSVSISLSGGEIIVRKDICQEEKEEKETIETSDHEETAAELPAKTEKTTETSSRNYVVFSVETDTARLSDLFRLLTNLTDKFKKMKISIEMSDGEISEDEWKRIERGLRSFD